MNIIMMFVFPVMAVGLTRNVLLMPCVLLLTALWTIFRMAAANRSSPQIFGNLNMLLRMFKIFSASQTLCAELLWTSITSSSGNQ